MVAIGTSRSSGPRLAPLRRLWPTGHRLGLTVLLLPSLLLIGLFTYYPAVKALIGGFYSWDGFNPPVYAGTSQFSRYIHSSTFFPELHNLAVLFIGSIMIACVVQFAAAEVIIHLRPRLGSIVKYALVLPIVMPPIVLISIWAYLYAPTSGLINEILHTLGLGQPNWLADPHLALIAILFIGFPWISNLGFLIFLGGLQNLPTEVLEASLIDGVGKLRRVFTIDVPLLLPQFRIVVVISGIAAVQNFVPILLLTGGGPNTATMVPGLDMYQSAFVSDLYGYGMAIATLLFIGMLVFTLVTIRVLKPRT